MDARPHRPGLGRVEQGSTPRRTSPTSWATAWCDPPWEACLADPFVIKEFSVALRAVHDSHLWLRAQPPISPTRCFCCTAETTVWSARRASTCSAKLSKDKRCAFTRASPRDIQRVQKDRVIRDAIEWLDDHVR
ncbi:MAG: hypothetical protein ACLT98_16470 [Eggerthellaceae bacterium]